MAAIAAADERTTVGRRSAGSLMFPAACARTGARPIPSGPVPGRHRRRPSITRHTITDYSRWTPRSLSVTATLRGRRRARRQGHRQTPTDAGGRPAGMRQYAASHVRHVSETWCTWRPEGTPRRDGRHGSGRPPVGM